MKSRRSTISRDRSGRSINDLRRPVTSFPYPGPFTELFAAPGGGAGPSGDAYLLESGDKYLLESGDFMLIE